MIMKTKDVFQRKWITDSITKRGCLKMIFGMASFVSAKK